MSYTTINKPNQYFNTLTWTGDGSASRNITGLDFQPDWVWGKCRNAAVSHAVYDSVRGASNLINTNTTSAEGTNAALNAFISNGFTVNSDSYLNGNSNTYVSWNWLASNTTASNTDGSITSTVSANTTSGFSIVSYTGNSTSGATVGHGLGAVPGNSTSGDTVGHGLGAVPSMIIWKDLGTNSWGVYHKSLGNTNAVFLDLTNASTSFSTLVNNTTPSSSLITLGSSTNSNNSRGMIAYCFAEKQGYSKFGSFVGNGQAFPNSPFIYLGFKPAFFMWKNTSDGGIDDNWNMVTAKSQEYNIQDAGYTMANTNGAETAFGGNQINFLSNGVKLNVASPYHNQSGSTYIYMAFAEAPLVGTNGVTAKGR
jgi:hypothetical protein